MVFRENEIHVFKTLIRKLQVVASFPGEGESFDYKLFRKYIITRILVMTPMVLVSSCHLYHSIKNGYVYEVATTVYYYNFANMYYSAYACLLIRGNNLLKFLKHFSEIRKENLPNYKKSVAHTETYTKMIYYSACAVTVATVFENYMTDSNCNNGELVNSPNYVCGGVFPIWLPITRSHFLIKPFCCLYIGLFIFFQIPNMLSLTCLYLGSVKLIELKINELIRLLGNIDFENETKHQAERKLKFCIQYYFGISSLVQEMNYNLGFIFAPTHNGNNNIMIGILAYLSIKLGSLPNAFQLLIWLFVQWMSCYSGQRLENASLLLQEKVYSMPWYHIHPSLRKTFRLFHAHVGLTFQMKILPITILNMEDFATILKGAYTFLMYLLKM